MRLRIAVVLLSLTVLEAAPVRRLTLEETVDLALRQNSLLKLARLKARENQARTVTARANYFPQLSTDANYWKTLEKQGVTIPTGVLGVFPDLGPLPQSPIRVEQGGISLLFTTTTLGQPLTQLIKIRQGHRIAGLDTAIAEADVKRAETEVALRAQEAYFGLLIAQAERRAAQLQVAFAGERLREAREAVETGKALAVASIGARAGWLEARHALLAVDNRISDINLELCDLAGLPLETAIEPVAPALDAVEAPSIEEMVRTAIDSSAEARAARFQVEKARRGVVAARADYIPEIGAFGQHVWQNGVPLLARNHGIGGLKMSWNGVDWGKRRGVGEERRALLEQAEENLRRVKNRLQVDVEKAYRKLERSREMTAVAREALELRRESARLAADQLDVGVVTASKAREAEAALAKAEADLLAAGLGARLARAELDRAAGIMPR
jgi:outer membrane protein TolC